MSVTEFADGTQQWLFIFHVLMRRGIFSISFIRVCLMANN